MTKKIIIKKLIEGKIDILFGTHRILSKDIGFKDIGLLVIDEEQRFGVTHKEKIKEYKSNIDVLTLSATPIPRTLALILYGDLDISIIDELPPNRKKIETYAVTKSMEERINNFIKKNIDEGRQIYVVCPLVEEKEERAESYRKNRKKENIFLRTINLNSIAIRILTRKNQRTI